MRFSASVVHSSYSTVLISLLLCLPLVIKEVSCVPTTTAADTTPTDDEGIRTTLATISTHHDTHSNSSSSSSPPSSSPPSSSEKPVSPPQAATTTAAKSNTKRTCACDDTEESLICASNGVTYKNSCRFECAKARVNRLRQVKQGRCSQAAGAQTYWQSQKSG